MGEELEQPDLALQLLMLRSGDKSRGPFAAKTHHDFIKTFYFIFLLNRLTFDPKS